MKVNLYDRLVQFGRNRISRLRLMTVGILSVVLIVCVFPNDAEAYLKFCNYSGAEASVAIAYEIKKPPGTYGWWTRNEGWWVIEPGQCKIVSNMDVRNQGNQVFYYAYSSELSWTGDAYLCVKPRKFEGEFERGKECPTGYPPKKFIHIETSTNKDRIVNLND